MPGISTSISESIRLSEVGTFAILHASGEIPAGVVAPIQVNLVVPQDWVILTDFIDFGSTTVSITPVASYNLYYEKGQYSNGFITASSRIIYPQVPSSQWIELWISNVSSVPIMDIQYDLSVHYYTYPKDQLQQIKNLLYALSEDNIEIKELLKRIAGEEKNANSS